jgi:hypothetical protein
LPLRNPAVTPPPARLSAGDMMKMRITIIAGSFVKSLIGLAASVLLCAALLVASQPALAQTMSLTYKGFNYVSYYNGAYENADSLPALVGTNANSVALALQYGIDVQNSAVYADAAYTDSMAGLAATIVEAKGHGLSVMVRPLIDFLDPAKIGTYNVGDWRSYYNPTNPAAFFASYKTMIVNVAQVAQANGAAILCIGAELDQLTGPNYHVYWTDIIASVRAVFSGKLTYSADWDANISPWQGQHGLTAGTGDLTTQVSFWSQLDYLGIDVYAPISDAANPLLADLVAGWTQVPTDPTSHAVTGNQSLISYFQSVATQTGKPLLFTEIGYESASDAARQPAGTSTNIYDPALQANLYSAFFSAWQQSGNNSLTGVYFWNWDPNAAEVGPGNGPNFSPQGQPAQTVVTTNFGMPPPPPPPPPLTATHDFNGDGKSDILWRNSDSTVGLWLMNGTQFTPSSFGVLPLSWTIVGQRDFNGDGKADILWRNADGTVGLWLMNGTQIVSTTSFGILPTSWTIVGTGDFNGDGKADILWRNADGTVGLWLMNGAQILSTTSFGILPLSWTIAGTGDFNGDGKADILWRNADGTVGLWLMNGAQIVSTTSFGILPTSWTIVGTGDFNGDGKTDILWRNADGTVGLWLMNGTQVVSTTSFGVLPVSWTIVGTGDFNGDGKSDILWRNADGTVGLWFMNGTQVVSTSSFGVLPTSWTIQGANAD